jgi:cyclophilin family peptidyl-prolyl cis-trans isomerase
MKRFGSVFMIMLIAFILMCCGRKEGSFLPGLYAEIETSKGNCTIRLDFDKVPMTVANFVGLAEGTIKSVMRKGLRFYDGSVFFRVVKNLMVQGGDPYGDGRGGPGYIIPFEYYPTLKHDRPYVVSMLRTGLSIHGCQFVILLKPAPWLDGRQPVFGRIVHGKEIADVLETGDIIRTVTIKRIGSAARAFKVDQDMFETMLRNVKARILDEQRREEEKHITEIKQRWPGLIESSSGLLYKINQEGKGESPEEGDKVIVNYKGELLDGTVVISSKNEGDYLSFINTDIIKGMNEMIFQMKKGESRLVITPPDMGFGEAGLPGLIPPHSFLIFTIELIDFIAGEEGEEQ